jgi:indole-3-glycerol phosphate synthase
MNTQPRFVKTNTILDRILARKVEEVNAVRDQLAAEPGLSAHIADLVRTAPPVRDFAAALHRDTIALIAEVKQASPSRGILIRSFDPVLLAHTYADGGAAAISVLTDESFFMGHLSHLRSVRESVDLPVLRKDFIIDSVQIQQARIAGADAVLLITAALDNVMLTRLMAEIRHLGMAALVEVHNEIELERALNAGADLIGINNRDLKTFREDLAVTERLAVRLPSGVTLVAESAIRTVDDVRRMGDAGAHAVLVGEGLVTAPDIGIQVRLFSSQAVRRFEQ